MGAVGFRCCNALSLGDVVILLGAGAASAVLQVHDGRVAVELQDDERPAQSGCAPAAMGASWTVTLAGAVSSRWANLAAHQSKFTDHLALLVHGRTSSTTT
jgi:hypothetical protein